MKIRNLNIGTRLGLGFGIQILLMAGAIGVGIIELNTINQTVNDIVKNNNVMLNAAHEMRAAQLNVMLASSKVVMLEDAAQRAEQEAMVGKARAAYDAASVILHA